MERLNQSEMSLEEAGEQIQKRVNEILHDNDTGQFDKLPGLIESLKIIRECITEDKVI